jgi:hypothetical protein
MVIMGIKNRPTTPAFESSGRMIYSFTLMGKLWPLICDSMPRTTKKATEFQKKNPKINANIVRRR